VTTNTPRRVAPALLDCRVGVRWALPGPLVGFLEIWQLAVAPATTIVTFRMVFLIQKIQNRDHLAGQLNLVEVIRTLDDADRMLPCDLTACSCGQERIAESQIGPIGG